jgi:hypothetical protein
MDYETEIKELKKKVVLIENKFNSVAIVLQKKVDEIEKASNFTPPVSNEEIDALLTGNPLTEDEICKLLEKTVYSSAAWQKILVKAMIRLLRKEYDDLDIVKIVTGELDIENNFEIYNAVMALEHGDVKEEIENNRPPIRRTREEKARQAIRERDGLEKRPEEKPQITFEELKKLQKKSKY